MKLPQHIVAFFVGLLLSVFRFEALAATVTYTMQTGNFNTTRTERNNNTNNTSNNTNNNIIINKQQQATT